MTNGTFVKILAGVTVVTAAAAIAIHYAHKKKPELASVDIPKDKEPEPEQTTIEKYDVIARQYGDTGEALEDISIQLERTLAEQTAPAEHEPALPYPISADQFESDHPEYKKVYVICYIRDGSFVEDDTNQVIEDARKSFGVGITNIQVGETRYIRNEKEGTDYVVNCVDAAWNDVFDTTT